MKVVTVFLGMMIGMVTMNLHAQQQPGQPMSGPQTNDQKRSYAIGVQVAEGIKSQGVDVNIDSLVSGLRDALSGAKLAMSDEEIGNTMMILQQEMQQKAEQSRTVMLEKNKKDGDDFLAANAKKDGVVSLPTGLQYRILTAGTGDRPTEDDTVVVNYRGTLLDGREFDSSIGRGPATFGVKDVIAGFRDAIQLMPVGSKWQVFIPSNLAYGERGAGNAIEPNSALIFEIELVSIQPKQ